MKLLRTAPDAPDFDQAADLTYDQAPTYDEVADPDYDEGQQPDYDPDFTEPDYEEAGQEYRPRKQK